MEAHDYIRDMKIIPQESYSDCLKRILDEHLVLKRQEEVRKQKEDIPLETLPYIPLAPEPTTGEPFLDSVNPSPVPEPVDSPPAPHHEERLNDTTN